MSSIPRVRLHVNVDHVATIRNARGTPYPDPVAAAEACLAAGADGITVHLREDRRHIVDDDVARLRRSVTATVNLEMAATDEMVTMACRVRPDVVTLVPERREERTTEGGLDVVAGGEALAKRVRALLDARIRVSLFIAADAPQLRASRELGVHQVELHTGEYAHEKSGELERLEKGAALGHSLGMEVAAGHGLTQANVVPLMKIDEIVELNIGHAIVSDAIFHGIGGAVRAMRSAIDRGLSARR